MKPNRISSRNHGFALVVTLTLMILLTIIAVGLLTLSSVSLRSASQGDAMATARANARLALLLAIGELQRTAGPDQRVTAPANLVDASKPMGITGVWKSWKPDPTGTSDSEYTQQRNGDNFLGYLISNPDPEGDEPNPDIIPGERLDKDLTEKLVSSGSLDKTNLIGREIVAPIVLTRSARGSKTQGGYAWVVLDEGVKARIDLEPAPETSGLGELITRVGSPARNRFEGVKGFEFLESDNEDHLRTELPKLVSMDQAKLMSSSPTELTEYFHDFTTSSVSLQANVADGGLKTDLSVAFEGQYLSGLPAEFSSRHLYSNESTPFPNDSSNADPLWSLYGNYSRLYRLNQPDKGNPASGLVAGLPEKYVLKSVPDRSSPSGSSRQPDMEQLDEPVLIPTVVRVEMVFTLVTRMAHLGWANTTYPYMLHLMYMPVITLHNPFNVPLRCKDLEVEFSDVPIGFQFLVNGQPSNTGGLMPLNDLYYKTGGAKKSFSVKLSSSLGESQEVVMGPGETRIFGTPFQPTRTWNSEIADQEHALMFDYQGKLTGERAKSVLHTPGLITGPLDGIGFDVDWLAPPSQMSSWMQSRGGGVIKLKANEEIQVRFGPTVPATAGGMFGITTWMDGQPLGNSQVAYKNVTTLNRVISEGTSPRFPETRSFPATFPAQGQQTITTLDIYEDGSTPFPDYARARPFVVFSVGAKTTVESFTMSRPLTDTGMAFQMANCNFSQGGSQGVSPLEFALVPIQNGSAAIESGGPNNHMAFFFGGHGSTNGTTSATIYEIPVAPLQSIAQLRNANGASIGSYPFVTYSVGESRAHPAIPPDRAVYMDSGSSVLDHSWLANSRLWDGYWFSTLSTLEGPAYQGSAAMSQSQLAARFFDGAKLLPNPRNTPYLPAGKPASRADAAADAISGGGKNSAAYILTDGGFNVNSTSVRAWTAVLSALAKSEIPLAGGTSEVSAGVPFPRLRRPAIGALDSGIDPKEKLWNSYRTLDANQVKKLAESIVDEVRQRGPFLSMADFVNRRLGSSSELTRSGALQAAVDKANINTIMESNARSIRANEVSGYGWKNPDAVTGSTGAGAPGEISQGDILSAIGSFVTVRSDTFRIRCYGDARDASGKVIARVWCEATVQRFPEYLDPTDAPEAAASTNTNLLFGRQFRVVAFRWLSANEI